MALGDRFFFACHDPLAVAVQSNSLAAFLIQVLRAHVDGGENALEQVRRLAEETLSAKMEDFIGVRQGRASNDRTLRDFAHRLSDSFMIVDLRDLRTGAGFTLWNLGFAGELLRCEGQLLWGLRFVKERTLFDRLFHPGSEC